MKANRPQLTKGKKMKNRGLRNLTLTLLVFASALALSAPASAKELKGVTMPDQLDVAGRTLKLNGMGLRLALFIKLKVYVGGLYLEKPSKNADAILASSQIKHVEMQFLRDVSAEKMVQAWNDSLETNCKSDCESLRPQLFKLTGAMFDVKEGDTMSFTFLPDAVVLSIKGQKKARLEGAALSKVLLMTWLGPNPPNDEIKEGMLGN